MSVRPMLELSRAYGIKPSLKMLYTLFGGAMIAGGIFSLLRASTGVQASSSVMAGVGLVAIGAGMLLWMMRARVIIDGARISVRNAISERSADLSEIEGFRTVSTRNGSYQRIMLKDGQPSISISSAFDLDEDYRAWMQQVTDLDQVSRDQVLDEISQDAELGATPVERLGALAQARQWSIAITVIAFAAAVGLNFGPASLQETCVVVLAITPVLACILLQRSPLIYTLLRRKSDPRADLSGALLAAGMGMFFRAQHFELVSTNSLLMIVIPLGVVFLVAFFNVILSNISPPAAFMALLVMAALYSYGLTVSADTVSDQAPMQLFTAQVLDKHYTTGRSSHYYLHLSAWGPIEQVSQVTVSGSVYRSTAQGSPACLALHPGSLRIQWYRVVDCSRPTRTDWFNR